MTEKTFNLEIITPRKVVFSGDVQSFTAPGSMGSFQVLFNHAPLLSEITIGEARLRDSSGGELRFATSAGFVEVNANHVVMLAETAERPEEIDGTRAEAAKSRAEKRLSHYSPDIDVERARLALARALNRLKIAHRV